MRDTVYFNKATYGNNFEFIRNNSPDGTRAHPRFPISFSQLSAGYYCNPLSLTRELYSSGFSDYEFAQCPDPLKYATNFLYTVRWIKFMCCQIRCVIYIIFK